MVPDLHLRPERLAAHAVRAAEVAHHLHSGVARFDRDGLPVEAEQVRAAALRVVRELDELAAVLAAVAATATESEETIRAGLAAVDDGQPVPAHPAPPPPGLPQAPEPGPSALRCALDGGAR